MRASQCVHFYAPQGASLVAPLGVQLQRSQPAFIYCHGNEASNSVRKYVTYLY
jgi:hypothetical protein